MSAKVIKYLIALLLISVLVGSVGATTLILSPASGSPYGDGYMRRLAIGTGDTFTNIRAGVGTSADYTGVYAVTGLGSIWMNPNYYTMDRAAFIFPTEQLPDDATVSSTTFSFGVYNKQTDLGDVGVGITEFLPQGGASQPFVGTSQYSLTYFDSTRLSTDKAMSSFGINSIQYYTLNSNGIAAVHTSIPSGFAVRTAWDIDNSAPAWIASVPTSANLYQIESGWQPHLQIEYSQPAPTPIPTTVPPTTTPITTAPTPVPAPIVTGIDPDSGINNGLTGVINITGTGFTEIDYVSLYINPGIEYVATNVSGSLGGTKITCTFDLNGVIPTDYYVKVYTTSHGVSTNSVIFTVTAAAPPPTVTGITPGTANNNQTIFITNLAGTGFVVSTLPNVSITRTNPQLQGGYFKIEATNITVVSTTKVTCSINLSGAEVGLWNVQLVNPDAQSAFLTNGFTVTAAVPPPSVTVVSWSWSYNESVSGTRSEGFSLKQNPYFSFGVMPGQTQSNYQIFLTTVDSNGNTNVSTQITWINLTNIGSVPGSGADSYTSTLLHFNGADNSTGITDEYGKTWVAVAYQSVSTPENFGARISSVDPKFGVGKLLLNSTAKAYVYSVQDSDFDLMNDNFTIDTWIKFDVNPGVAFPPGEQWTIFSYFDGTPGNGYGLFYGYDAGLGGYYDLQFVAWNWKTQSLTVSNSSTSPFITPGTWHHLAVVEHLPYGSSIHNVTVYLDGNAVASKQRTVLYTAPAASFAIGQYLAQSWANISVDEFRIAKGYARWIGNFQPPTAPAPDYTWTYTGAGSYQWTCPSDVSSVDFDVVGAGGSGHNTYNNYAGLGGAAGEHIFTNSYVVTPGVTYNIVVGRGGNTTVKDSETKSNNGEPSSVFNTVIASGGVGGLDSGRQDVAGGVGSTGYLTGGNAEDGSNGTFTNPVFIYPGGIAGIGYGAGGGGGAGLYYAGLYGTGDGFGGRGSDGYVYIKTHGYVLGNIPDFSANEVSVYSGTSVHFTDSSLIRDSTNLTYLWDFGDGGTSTTVGDTSHVYAYLGTFTVSLRITSAGGSNIETKNEYISVITAAPQELDLKTEPRDITFHVIEGYGTTVSGVTISIQSVSTSTGDWDWIVSLLGIPLDVANINSTLMTQTTDSYGNAEFLMIPTAKYNITFTKSGYTIPSLVIVPTLTYYIINANPTSGEIYRYGVDELEAVNITITSANINASAVMLNLSYIDITGHTTGGYIDVLQKNDTPWGIPNLNKRWSVFPGVNFTNYTTVMHVTQVSGYVDVEVTHSDFTKGIQRTYPFSFNSIPVEFLGFGSDITLLVAMGIMLFTVMLGGATHARQVVFVMAVEGWVFYAMHWFNSLLARGVQEYQLFTILGIITVIAILANIEIRKKKENK